MHNLALLAFWMVIFKVLVGCHDILIFGKSPIKWRQRPDMTLAVDWHVKYQFKQTNKAKHLELSIIDIGLKFYALPS